MNRVLVTGGAGMIGAAAARRLLRDPSWEVRISDQRQAPGWMREGCEVNTGDLRSLTRAREAVALQADRRALLPRCARRARPALHDLPTLRSLRTHRGHRGAAGRAGGPGEWTRTPTHVDDVADGIVIAMASAGGEGEDFNLAAREELTLAEIAGLCAGLAPLPAPADRAVRRYPSVDKAHRLLGWEVRIDACEGLPETAMALRERAPV